MTDKDFRQAACDGNVAELQKLYQAEFLDSCGAGTLKTALHWAAKYGRIRVVEWLISKGAKLDLQDKDGKTALQLALQGNHLAVCQKLILAGAKLPTQGAAYQIPPLIFLTRHDDPTPFDLVTDNLPLLTALGYQTVCFEFDQSLSYQQTMSSFIQFLLCSTDDEERRMYDLILTNLKALVDGGLCYRGIDDDLGELRCESNKKLSKPSEKNGKTDPESMNRRNRIMAGHIVREADKANGGVIAFIGAGHIQLSQHIATQAADRLNQFCLVNFHIPLNSNIHNIFELFLRLSLTNGIPQIDVGGNMSKEERDKKLLSKIFKHVKQLTDNRTPGQPLVLSTQNNEAMIRQLSEANTSHPLTLSDVSRGQHRP